MLNDDRRVHWRSRPVRRSCGSVSAETGDASHEWNRPRLRRVREQDSGSLMTYGGPADQRENGLAPTRLVLGGGTGGVTPIVAAGRGARTDPEAGPGADDGATAGLEGASPGGLRSTGLDISVPGTKLRR